MSQRTNRRGFLKSTALTSAGFWVAASRDAFARSKSPNEKINIAGIGVGGMGRGNLKACAGENIVALCDVDQDYAAKTFKEYPQAKVYRDFRVMLDKQKDIDAVIVATPDHTHAVIALAAIRAGKHVYVQKPLTHSVYEARVLTEEARKRKVVTQMGNQGIPAMARAWSANGSGPASSERCVTSRSGPTARSGPKGWKWSVLRKSRRSGLALIGISGSVRPLTGHIIRPTSRALGGLGGILALARWETWAATCSTRRFGR